MEKYAKLDKIGEGSFGVAYLARIKGSNKQVVLKEINLTKMTKKESDEARKEVAVLAQLKHSNIVSYLESFELMGNLYIVMDYCDGGDLFGRINAQHGMLFAEDQILDWFVQMCLAVKHIHDRKILHRDIKSQNIFLTKSGLVKLGDFGIAKVLNSTVELARTCIGTPYYLSPEICEAKPYNNKSDIWSLGCVLYELLTLKHAFEAPSMKALVLNIIRGNYAPPSARYSGELRVLIAAMFKKNPRDRPSVNTILKKPLLQAKIQSILLKFETAEGFTQTMMQGLKLQHAMESVQQPRPLPPRPLPTPNRQPQSPYAPRYNPAAVYGPSIANRKSRENLCKDSRKSAEVKKSAGQDRQSVRRSSGSGNSRPPSAGPLVQDPAKRRQEFNEKENEKRKEILKKQDLELQKQHKLLLEKQRLARLNKNRDDGWRSVLSSNNLDEKEANPGAVVNVNVVREIGNYDHHLAQLRKLEDRSLEEPVPSSEPTNFKGEESNLADGEKLRLHAGNVGAVVSERARIYQEFIQRKEAAALNRARAQGGTPLPLSVPSPTKPVLAGAPSPSSVMPHAKPVWAAAVPTLSPVLSPHKPTWAVAALAPSPGPSGDQVSVPPKVAEDNKVKEEIVKGVGGAAASSIPNPISADVGDRPSSARIWEDEKRKQEEEHLAKLRQIRLQNFHERFLREKNAAQIHSPSNVFPSQDFGYNDEKKKEIEALKAQADLRAKKLLDLERQRRQIQERKAQELHRLLDRQVRAQRALPSKVEPSKPSVGLTAAMVAIGAAQLEAEEPNDLKAQKKKTILKRVNLSFSETEPDESQGGGKWSKGGVTHILGQMKLEEAEKGKNVGLRNVVDKLRLEEKIEEIDTAEMTDKASNEMSDDVDPLVHGAESAAAPPRKQWPTQRGTVVNILSSADIYEATRGKSNTAQSVKETTVIERQQDVSTTDEPESMNAEEVGARDLALCRSESFDDIKPPQQSNFQKVENFKEEDETLKKDVKTRSSVESVSSAEEDVTVPTDRCPADDQLELDELKGPESHNEDEDKLFLPGRGYSLKSCLASGRFDVENVKLLRSCSEPDLHKLSQAQRLAQSDKVKDVAKSSGDIRDDSCEEDSGDDEYEENEKMVSALEHLAEVDDGYDLSVSDLDHDNPLDESSAPSEDVVCDEAKSLETTLIESDINDEAGFDSDDSDLRTLRESMANILANNDEVSDEELTMNTATKTKKKKKGKCAKKGKKKKSKEAVNDDSSSLAKAWSDTSFEDFQSMKETMKSLLQPTKPSSTATTPKTLDTIVESSFVRESKDDEEECQTINPVNESSDFDFDKADDDYFEDDGIFARLEGMRASLEDQLGCETFLKAYATVQAFQEEDEDMEEGIKMVTRILGPDNVYLYPSILQLVMADASFSDNGL